MLVLVHAASEQPLAAAASAPAAATACTEAAAGCGKGSGGTCSLLPAGHLPTACMCFLSEIVGLAQAQQQGHTCRMPGQCPPAPCAAAQRALQRATALEVVTGMPLQLSCPGMPHPLSALEHSCTPHSSAGQLPLAAARSRLGQRARRAACGRALGTPCSGQGNGQRAAGQRARARWCELKSALPANC